MVAVTLMWSIAGVVTRHLEAARGFEVTFWRSAFNALALLAMLGWMRGPAALWRRCAGRPGVVDVGACWCVMYTAFMMALTLTTVANVLITMALAPLFTALGARLVLGHRLARAPGRHRRGRHRHRLDVRPRGRRRGLAAPAGHAGGAGRADRRGRQLDADAAPAPRRRRLWRRRPTCCRRCWSARCCRPPSRCRWRCRSGPRRTTWACWRLLGVVQLAIPCLMAMGVARAEGARDLAAGPAGGGVRRAWAWLGAGEAPSLPVLGGGALVLAALVFNECWAAAGAAAAAWR
jgi:hypothetical protein